MQPWKNQLGFFFPKTFDGYSFIARKYKKEPCHFVSFSESFLLHISMCLYVLLLYFKAKRCVILQSEVTPYLIVTVTRDSRSFPGEQRRDRCEYHCLFSTLKTVLSKQVVGHRYTFTHTQALKQQLSHDRGISYPY